MRVTCEELNAPLCSSCSCDFPTSVACDMEFWKSQIESCQDIKQLVLDHIRHGFLPNKLARMRAAILYYQPQHIDIADKILLLI